LISPHLKGKSPSEKSTKEKPGMVGKNDRQGGGQEKQKRASTGKKEKDKTNATGGEAPPRLQNVRCSQKEHHQAKNSNEKKNKRKKKGFLKKG